MVQLVLLVLIGVQLVHQRFQGSEIQFTQVSVGGAVQDTLNLLELQDGTITRATNIVFSSGHLIVNDGGGNKIRCRYLPFARLL